MKRRIVSVLMTLTLCLSLLPTAALAAEQAEAPSAKIDFKTAMITDLESDTKYQLTNEGDEEWSTSEWADENGCIEIDELWFGETFFLARINNDNETFSENAQRLEIPDRPEAPVLTEEEFDFYLEPGETVSTTVAMEYSVNGGDTWLPCKADMTAEDFGWDGKNSVFAEVRYPADEDSFASWERDVRIEATPAVWVGGVWVTEANAAEKLGEHGSVAYDPDTETLTLTLIDATINNPEGCGIYAEDICLVINGVDTEAEGDNSISCASVTEEDGTVPGYGIQVQNGDLTINGTLGSIAAGEDCGGISVAGDLTINGTVGDITADFESIFAVGAIEISGKVGDITSGDNGMEAGLGGITISGTVGNVNAAAIGLCTGSGNVTLEETAQVGTITALCGIQASQEIDWDEEDNKIRRYGDVSIDGALEEICAEVVGIYAEGEVNIAIPLEVSAESDEYNQNHAILAYGGINLDGVTISVPADGSIEVYDEDEETWYSTVCDSEGNIALSVKLEPCFVVTLDTGDEFESYEVVAGQTFAQPEEPVRAGHVFAGWYVYGEEGEEIAFDFDTPIEEDTYIFAKWTWVGPIYVDGVKVTEDNADDVLGDGTVTYDVESNILTLTGADITNGYAYKAGAEVGIYAEGDLNIELVGENSIKAPSGKAISAGIRIKNGDLEISGSGFLSTIGGDVSAETYADTSGIVVDGWLSINEASVIATGGSAVTTGTYSEEDVDEDSGAYSSGVYTEGGLDLDMGSNLIATGGTAKGVYAYSNGIEAYGDEENDLSLSVWDGYLEASGNTAEGVLEAGSSGVYAVWGGLRVYEGDAVVELRAGSAKASSTDEAAKPYAYSNGIYVYAGSVGIDAGTVEISGGSWEGLNGDGYAVYARSYVEESEDGEYRAASGGSFDVACDEISVNLNGYGFVGTKVTLTSQEDAAIWAQMDIDVEDTLMISTPEGGEVAGQGEWSDYEWDYYTIVDQDGTAATTVVIEPLTYKVTFSGMSYGMALTVPAGWSLNEGYCERFKVEDVSEALDTDKSGYTFVGWYTDEACTSGNEFSFDSEIEADVTIYPKWTKNTSSSSGGGGGSSNTKTETTRNDDGSTTTTTTNKKTGVVTETTTTKDGVTGTVVTDKKGEITEISAKVPAAAAKDGEAVTLPLEVKAADSAEDAPEIEVDVPAGGAAVEIPVKNVTPGTVVVRVNKNGSEEILMTSAVSENGVLVTLDQDSVLKVVDNGREFADVHDADHWAADAVDFVAARGIFGGTSVNTFTPNGTMTRQAMWMVLARMSGETPADMAEARAWAVESGVSDGSYPAVSVTRQQFVTMLWRWAQGWGVDVSVGEDTNVLSYGDAFSISDYAVPAVQWACGEGIMNGYADGTLCPYNTATRAHVAKMLMNFLNR